MERSRVRTVLVGLICLLTLVTSAWGASPRSLTVRRGHPNDRFRTPTLASQNFIAITLPFRPFMTSSLVFRWGSRSSETTETTKRHQNLRLTTSGKPAMGGK